MGWQPAVFAHYSHLPVLNVGQDLIPFAEALCLQYVWREFSGVDRIADLNPKCSLRILLHSMTVAD